MPSGFCSKHRHTLPPKSESGLRGVYEVRRGPKGRTLRKPFKSYIRHKGRYIVIGYFATRLEAARAYNKVASKFKGVGTYLNPIPC